MPRKPHITHAAPQPASEFTYDSLLSRFKRARSEDTLDIMYKGALNRIARELNGKERFLAEIEAVRALDRCQQDFDHTVLGMDRKTNFALKQASINERPYNPDDELQRLLSDL